MQAEALISHVLHIKSHFLQILLSNASPYSFTTTQKSPHVLELLLPHLGSTQAAMQLFPLRYRGELQLVQFVAIPEQVLHRELHVVHALLLDLSTY